MNGVNSLLSKGLLSKEQKAAELAELMDCFESL